MTEFTNPFGRGFTLPIAATLPSAASRALRIGTRSGRGTLVPPIVPSGYRARTRSWIARTTASSSCAFTSDSKATLFAPGRPDCRPDPTPRGEVARESSGNRITRLHHVAQELVDDVFVKDAEAAIGKL